MEVELIMADDNAKALQRLLSINVEMVSDEELRSLVNHLQDQVGDTYMYIVGQWNNAKRARNIRNGQFVANQEVIDYLS